MFSFDALLREKGRPLVMGILNITPDSFSDGGEAASPEAALSRAKQIERDGADILDIGACSTAPMNAVADEQTELSRLQEILPLIAKHISIPISVDTFRPRAAEYALQNGAEIVNDESGAFSSEMAQLISGNAAGWIFMHTGSCTSRETAVYPNGVVPAVRDFFSEMRAQAKAHGIRGEQLCFDCGIGFGKSREDDKLLLANLRELSGFSPLLIGASRKRVIGELTGVSEPQKRVAGTVAANAVAVFSGADIVRVHDVRAARETVAVAGGLRNYQ